MVLHACPFLENAWLVNDKKKVSDTGKNSQSKTIPKRSKIPPNIPLYLSVPRNNTELAALIISIQMNN